MEVAYFDIDCRTLPHKKGKCPEDGHIMCSLVLWEVHKSDTDINLKTAPEKLPAKDVP